MTSKEKKCAHPACSCTVPEGEAYCSTSCEDAAGIIELSCNCEHATCETLTSRPNEVPGPMKCPDLRRERSDAPDVDKD